MSTLHLLMWLTAIAMLLITQRSGFSSAYQILPLLAEQRWSSSLAVSALVFGMLDDAVLGFAICGFLVGVTSVMQGRPFFHHPGHWLLAVTGGVGLTWIAVGLVTRFSLLFALGPNVPELRFEVYASAILALAQVVVYGAVWTLCAARRFWKVVLAAIATRSLFELAAVAFSILAMPFWRIQWLFWVPWEWSHTQWTDASLVLSLLPKCLAPVIGVLLAVTLIRDRHENGRDWAHWLGGFVVLWSSFWTSLTLIPQIRFVLQSFA